MSLSGFREQSVRFPHEFSLGHSQVAIAVIGIFIFIGNWPEIIFNIGWTLAENGGMKLQVVQKVRTGFSASDFSDAIERRFASPEWWERQWPHE